MDNPSTLWHKFLWQGVLHLHTDSTPLPHFVTPHASRLLNLKWCRRKGEAQVWTIQQLSGILTYRAVTKFCFGSLVVNLETSAR